MNKNWIYTNKSNLGDKYLDEKNAVDLKALKLCNPKSINNTKIDNFQVILILNFIFQILTIIKNI